MSGEMEHHFESLVFFFVCVCGGGGGGGVTLYAKLDLHLFKETK